MRFVLFFKQSIDYFSSYHPLILQAFPITHSQIFTMAGRIEPYEGYFKYSKILRDMIDKEASQGDENTLDVTLLGGISAISLRATQTDTQFDAMGAELQDQWYVAIQAAKNWDWQNPKQSVLVWQILSTREIGTITRRLLVEGIKQNLPVQTADGLLWTDLPFFISELRIVWEDSMRLPAH